MLFTHFYLLQGKKNRNLSCISSKQVILELWTHNISVNKLTKTPFAGINCQIFFFIDVAIKKLFHWVGVQLQCPCANLMIFCLRFRNDVLIVLFWFGFCAIDFEDITSIVDKTHHGPVIAPFLMQVLQLF